MAQLKEKQDKLANIEAKVTYCITDLGHTYTCRFNTILKSIGMVLEKQSNKVGMFTASCSACLFI